jgi:NADH-quinone oxidoreductase subunit L
MQNLWIIPALPFIGFLINGIFGRKLPKAVIGLIAVLSTISPGSRAASSPWAGISPSTS